MNNKDYNRYKNINLNPENKQEEPMDKRRKFRSEAQDTGHISRDFDQEQFDKNLEYNIKHSMPTGAVFIDSTNLTQTVNNLTQIANKLRYVQNKKKQLHELLNTSNPKQQQKIKIRLKEIENEEKSLNENLIKIDL